MPTLKTSFPIVPVKYFALLCDFLESIDVRSADVLCAAHLDRDKLDQVNLAMTPRQVELLLSEARRRSGRSDLAFELGRRIKMNPHDIFSFALLSCATLDHMMQLFARYHRLVLPMLTMDYRREGDHAELVFRPALPMAPHTQRFWLETTAIATYLQITSVLRERPSAYEIYMSMEAPPHRARYGELGPGNFHFARSPLPEVRMQIKGMHLDAALPTANPLAVSLAEERCKAMLLGARAQDSWSDRVSRMLLQAEDCQPTLEYLAKTLNVTARTLDRYLDREGTSFRELSVRIRSQRARELLADGRLTVSQIAYTLGYTDIANFSRSFKKACGVCPTAFKGEQRGRAALRAA